MDPAFILNIYCPYFAMKKVANYLSNGGRIINFSTKITELLLPSYSLYAATKGAVEQMTRVFVKELGSKKITVNAVAPGPTETEFFTTGKTEEQIQAYSKMPALQRLGQPNDIAKVVAFLCSDDSEWISGQTIFANGGLV
ncbi:MAG: SDR family oxidoreductase [Bacillota bacterium]|nr:SDR family oxidoreductase [Bacillota bacterium]